MLRADIGRIGLAGNLAESDGLVSDPFGTPSFVEGVAYGVGDLAPPIGASIDDEIVIEKVAEPLRREEWYILPAQAIREYREAVEHVPPQLAVVLTIASPIM